MASILKPTINGIKKIWYVKYKYRGKWVKKSLGVQTKKKALVLLEKYKEYETDDRFDIVHREPVTLGQFLKRHLDHAQMENSLKWFKDKRNFLENTIVPYFGKDTRLKDITADWIEQYKAHRIKTVSARTVNMEITVLITLLHQAVEWKVTPFEYQVPKIKKLKLPPKPPRFLSDGEIIMLLDHAEKHSDQMYCFCMLMIYAGLRSGEALALRCSDISLERNAILITAYEFTDHTGKKIKWVPKTFQRRAIPMMDRLKQYLTKRLQAVGGSTFIVKGQDGISDDRLKKLLTTVIAASGLPINGDNKVTAHTCRHTFASHLVMRGVSLYDVSKMLGHTSIKTTEIYAHLAPDHLQEAMKRIEF